VLDQLRVQKETSAGRTLDGDLFRGRRLLHWVIRDRRLGGSYNSAIALASEDDIDFIGAGTDMIGADFQYEIAASMLLSGRQGEVSHAMRTTFTGYWEAVEEYHYPDRYLVDLADALALWACDDLPGAAMLLDRSQRTLDERGRNTDRYALDVVLLSLARADLAVARGEDATDDLGRSLQAVEQIRSRWQVVSRSASPLTVAFQRLYGDLARIAASTTGRPAAEAGLRVALSAKQSGFAARIRADRSEIDESWDEVPHLRSLIERVVDAEERALLDPTIAEEISERELDDLRRQLEEALSPMLAAAVLPVPASAAETIAAVGNRYALDHVGLPDMITGVVSWFQTLIEPDGTISFRELIDTPELNAMAGSAEAVSEAYLRVNWLALGRELLPDRLRSVLRAAHYPVRLVVSAHSTLGVVPWAAVQIDEHTQLVQRAVITQTPVLTCLSGSHPTPVAGRALIQLVSEDRYGPAGVNVKNERELWGIPEALDRSVPLTACDLAPDGQPTRLPDTFVAALSGPDAAWAFVHLAAHGAGTGLAQTVALPGSPVSAGRALTLRWPPAVLMASCHMGRLPDTVHAEPLSFVMAALSGGAECVVAAFGAVDDFIAGLLAADVAGRCRAGAALDVALQEAQLSLASWCHAWNWAVFVAYAR
jgi:hypothetical protein